MFTIHNVADTVYNIVERDGHLRGFDLTAFSSIL